MSVYCLWGVLSLDGWPSCGLAVSTRVRGTFSYPIPSFPLRPVGSVRSTEPAGRSPALDLYKQHFPETP